MKPYILFLFGLAAKIHALPTAQCLGMQNPTGDPNNPSYIFEIEMQNFASTGSRQSICDSIQSRIEGLQSEGAGFSSNHLIDPGTQCLVDDGSNTASAMVSFIGSTLSMASLVQTAVTQAFDTDGVDFTPCSIQF